MLKILNFAPALGRRTAAALEQFQQDFPQFAFDRLLLQPAGEFVTRGKLFRGSLCLAVSQVLAGRVRPSEAMWSVAVALELAGSAILIQDDVMDQAELRRDLPALHRQYATLTSFTPTSKRAQLFGESMALCVSDVLFFVASQMLMEAKCSAKQRVALMQITSREIATLALNQAEELRLANLELSDPSITEAEILAILVGKTARYTAQWPLQFAAILAGADLTTQHTLQKFGQAMGLVFQLSDDRLGLFGDPAQTGKDHDSDAKSGKKTLYAWFAHKKLRSEAAVTFHRLYGKPDLTLTELRELQVLLKNNGIVEKVDTITARYIKEAKQALKSLASWPDLQTILTGTVDFLATRQR